MRIRIRPLAAVSVLVLASSAAAEVETNIAPGEEISVGTEPPGADARKHGLTALREGSHFAAAAAFREAAGQGDAEAMRHLADMAFSGKGIAQSYGHAIRWYCQAALAADLDSVERLESIELSSWATKRASLGWEAACEQWLKPSPPPVPLQSSPPPPPVSVEIVVQPERYAPSVVWPGYPPWQWRWANPRYKPRKPVHPRPPVHAPGLYSR